MVSKETGFLSTPMGNLYYEYHHKESLSTPIICMPAGPGLTHLYYAPLLKLAEQRPLILFDPIDTGLSARTHKKENWQVLFYIEQITEIIDQLNLKTFHFISHSCSSGFGVCFDLQDKKRLVSHVMFSPVISFKKWKEDLQKLLKNLPPKEQGIIEKTLASRDYGNADYQKVVANFQKEHWCRVPWPEELKKDVENLNGKVMEAIYGPTLFDTRGYLDQLDTDFMTMKRIEQIGTPCCIIGGEHDVVSEKTLASYHHLIEGSILDIFPESSHMPFIEQPHRSIAIIESFFESCEYNKQISFD